jgi:putative aminopeptidase FrvX
MTDIGSLLQMFSDAHGMSGYEDDVAALLRTEMEPLVDEVHTDMMGNVIGIRSGEGPTVMVAAHMDEIGLVVSHIDDEGFLRVVSVGGFFDQIILGQRVLIHGHDGKVLAGVVGARPIHLMDAEERKKMVKLKEMFVDCGATSAANAVELGVEIGSPITLDRQFAHLGNDFVTGKALDNRAGVVMMISALQRLKGRPLKATIQAVGTVQEEVGLKGARTSAFGLSPDVAIATDVTIPGDHPGVSKNECHVLAGKGPSITILDAGGRGVIAPRPVVKWLRESAERESIPHQFSVGDGGNTDATAINITKAGIPCGVICVPARYIHSPVEVLSLRDLDNGAALIAAAIERVHEYF